MISMLWKVLNERINVAYLGYLALRADHFLKPLPTLYSLYTKCISSNDHENNYYKYWPEINYQQWNL